MASHSPPLDALVVPSEDYHQVDSHFFSLRFGYEYMFNLRFSNWTIFLVETLDSCCMPVKFLFIQSESFHFFF